MYRKVYMVEAIGDGETADDMLKYRNYFRNKKLAMKAYRKLIKKDYDVMIREMPKKYIAYLED